MIPVHSLIPRAAAVCAALQTGVARTALHQLKACALTARSFASSSSHLGSNGSHLGCNGSSSVLNHSGVRAHLNGATVKIANPVEEAFAILRQNDLLNISYFPTIKSYPQRAVSFAKGIVILKQAGLLLEQNEKLLLSREHLSPERVATVLKHLHEKLPPGRVIKPQIYDFILKVMEQAEHPNKG